MAYDVLSCLSVSLEHIMPPKPLYPNRLIVAGIHNDENVVDPVLGHLWWALCWVTRGRCCAVLGYLWRALCWVTRGGRCAGSPMVGVVLCWVTRGGHCAGLPMAGAVLGLPALDYTSSSQGLLLTWDSALQLLRSCSESSLLFFLSWRS